MIETLAVILAGGKGARLEPLTRDRAKPAVPFGGNYRIIDFTLSNCLNSQISKVLVLTQYKAMSLWRHIDRGWQHFFRRDLGEFIDVVPPQQRIDEHWYQGTADAVYQNIYILEKVRPRYVVILAGDHIYKMNYQSMVEFHAFEQADLTIGALVVDRAAAKSFGVMQVDPQNRVIGFSEKSAEPPTIPGSSDRCLASMGIYVFDTRFLFECLCRDANDPRSAKDFGRDVIPSIIDSQKVLAFRFRDENRKNDEAYWRDVGTIDAYFQAHMDLISVDPQLNLYDEVWPIRTHQVNRPPSKFVFGSGGESDRAGRAMDSMACNGCIVSGGLVERSLLGPNVRINSYSQVSESILFDGVQVGRYAKIRRAIIDKGVVVPSGMEIGYDLELDRQRGFTVSENGIVVIAKGERLETAHDLRPHRVGKKLNHTPPA